MQPLFFCFRAKAFTSFSLATKNLHLPTLPSLGGQILVRFTLQPIMFPVQVTFALFCSQEEMACFAVSAHAAQVFSVEPQQSQIQISMFLIKLLVAAYPAACT